MTVQKIDEWNEVVLRKRSLTALGAIRASSKALYLDQEEYTVSDPVERVICGQLYQMFFGPIHLGILKVHIERLESELASLSSVLRAAENYVQGEGARSPEIREPAAVSGEEDQEKATAPLSERSMRLNQVRNIMDESEKKKQEWEAVFCDEDGGVSASSGSIPMASQLENQPVSREAPSADVNRTGVMLFTAGGLEAARLRHPLVSFISRCGGMLAVRVKSALRSEEWLVHIIDSIFESFLDASSDFCLLNVSPWTTGVGRGVSKIGATVGTHRGQSLASKADENSVSGCFVGLYSFAHLVYKWLVNMFRNVRVADQVAWDIVTCIQRYREPSWISIFGHFLDESYSMEAFTGVLQGLAAIRECAEGPWFPVGNEIQSAPAANQCWARA